MQSETATCRHSLAKYCVGTGLDIGFGGDPIVPAAICVDKIQFSPNQTHCVGNASKLVWFANHTLDYVYSSHCLEDFWDTANTFREWFRVLRPGGNMVLFLPDQKRYLAHCAATNALPNLDHRHKDFGLVFVKCALEEAGMASSKIIHAADPLDYNPYSFELVIRT